MKKSILRNTLSLVLCATLVFTLLPMVALADASSYGYIDENGDQQTTSGSVALIDSSWTGTHTLTDGWYVATGSVSTGTLTVTGDVHLILADGASLAATGSGDSPGISVVVSNSLTIYGQSTGANIGSLDAASGSSSTNGAGIGGDFTENAGTITINGGKITANGSNGGGAGIGGGGNGGDGGTVTINGGVVTAYNNAGGAGIGGGQSNGGDGGTVTINGGTITAMGGNYGGAGIGGGSNGGDGGSVTINGGTVKATGGNVNAEAIGKGEGGASSGTLQNSSGDNVYLTTVTLNGGTGTGLDEAAITSLASSLSYNYGITDMKTDSSGKLYLYLPAGSCDLQLSDGTNGYAASSTVDTSGTTAITANDLSSTCVNITEAGTYVLTGTTVANNVTLNGGTQEVPINITLNGVSIDTSATDGSCAVELQGSSVVNLTLYSGTSNDLKSGKNKAGLAVPANATITIDGTGSLAANGGICGAGIGGYGDSTGVLVEAGTIIINDGTVTANGNIDGTGIGGGFEGKGGTVIINGGIVTATGWGVTGDAADIGGACNENGGTVIITGGIVTATSNDGAGIGCNSSGNSGTVTISGGTVTATGIGGTVFISGGSVHATGSTGTLQNGSGEDVCLTTVTLDGVSAITEVSALTASLDYTYGTNDMNTDASGILYLYLPNNTLTWGAQTSGQGYSGAITTTTDSATSLGTLTTDSALPTVTDVTPDGAGASIIGNIAVTFSEAMNTSAGTVSLNGGATTLTGGVWSSGNKVYTAPYSGLFYGTAYTVTISGFTDAAGNAMADDSTHSFTTVPNSDAALSGLILSQGTLSPAFSSGVYAYTVSLANNVSSLTVTPTANDANAAVTVNGAAVSSGTASGDISLSVGSNTIAVEVTAQDGITTQTYTVTVTRAQAESDGGGSSTVYYTITAAASEGGRISPSGSASVAYGNDKMYTITANEGYEIEDVLVDDVSIGAVDTYTFENVKKAHTITASFQKTEIVNPFGDVSADHWFYDNVLYVYENGLMTGTGSDTFSPNGTLTRAMLATVLYRLSGDTVIYTNNFSDIESGAWYENAVAWAAANGIASGTGGSQFAPDSAVSREQLAVMLYNYAKYKGYDVSVGKDTNTLSYNDALDISDYAYAALQWACGAGIINGDDSGNLNPQSSANRAEVAAMLQRFIKSNAPD